MKEHQQRKTKEQVIHLRVQSEEKELIRQAAEKAEMSISQYIRSTALQRADKEDISSEGKNKADMH